MFGNTIGVPELIIILVVVLVIFGPKQLPKLGKMFGKTMKEVRTGIDEATQEAKAASEPETSTSDAPSAQGRLAEIDGELERLSDLYIKGTLPKEKLDSMQAALLTEQAELKASLA